MNIRPTIPAGVGNVESFALLDEITAAGVLLESLAMKIGATPTVDHIFLKTGVTDLRLGLEALVRAVNG